MADLLEAYNNFKSGKGAIYALTIYISIVLILHWFIKYDLHFDDTELVLSIEAAYGVPLMQMVYKKIEDDRKIHEEQQRIKDEERAQDLKYMAHLIEAVHALLTHAQEKEEP